MDELPAGAVGTTLAAIAGGALPRHPKAAELLDVPMQQPARLGVLIALPRRRRLQTGKAMEPVAAQNAGDGAEAECLADPAVGRAGPAAR